MAGRIEIYTDGGSRGNPGNAASAFVIFDEKNSIIHEYAEYIGKNTNNVAEYTALINALTYAKDLKTSEVTCFSDSEVMVKQINGQYKINAAHLKELNLKVKALASKFKKITFKNLRRSDEKIARADALVNECLDRNENNMLSFSGNDL
ncbi:MAG: ribonuclease HI family protein [Candidatus Woesearchaeota archaeon]